MVMAQEEGSGTAAMATLSMEMEPALAPLVKAPALVSERVTLPLTREVKTW